MFERITLAAGCRNIEEEKQLRKQCNGPGYDNCGLDHGGK